MTPIPFEIEQMNLRLKDNYGIDTLTGLPMWRIVFSDDQYEKRLTHFTDAGIELLFAEVRELPKYKQWVHHKWVLENLVKVPPAAIRELAGAAISYELLFVFQDDKDRPLPPKYEVCEFVIHNVEMAKGKSFNIAKYQENPEKAAKDLAAMHEYLHGNETRIGDSLAYGEGVTVPSTYEGPSGDSNR